MKYKTLGLITLIYLTAGVPIAIVCSDHSDSIRFIAVAVLAISLFIWNEYLDLG